MSGFARESARTPFAEAGFATAKSLSLCNLNDGNPGSFDRDMRCTPSQIMRRVLVQVRSRETIGISSRRSIRFCERPIP